MDTKISKREKRGRGVHSTPLSLYSRHSPPGQPGEDVREGLWLFCLVKNVKAERLKAKSFKALDTFKRLETTTPDNKKFKTKTRDIRSISKRDGIYFTRVAMNYEGKTK